MDDALKRRKEEFVTGHGGSSLWQIQQILILPVFCCLMWFRVCQDRRWVPHQTRSYSWIWYYLVDYILLISPVYWVIIDSKYAVPIMTFASIWMAVEAVIVSGKLTPTQHTDKPAYISIYRAYMQILTVVCILAVDFPVFPRYHAKVETYGTSLMDIGVGMFIFSSGLMAGPRLERSRYLSAASKFYSTVKISLPLFLVGLVRLFTTKTLNYQEHVSEYGVHWNFFFTLMLIPCWVTLLDTWLPCDLPYLVLGILVAFIYQVALYYGIEEYIMTAPRIDLISMNKEGIFSSFGYLSIFLIACHIGKYCLSPRQPSKGVFLLLNTCVFACMLAITNGLELNISRRLANLGYIAWVVTSNLMILSSLYLVDTYFNPLHQLPIWVAAVNRNQLAIFLIANLLTGAVNLSIVTLDTPDSMAHIILNGYTFLVGLIGVILDQLVDITLKL